MSGISTSVVRDNGIDGVDQSVPVLFLIKLIQDYIHILGGNNQIHPVAEKGEAGGGTGTEKSLELGRKEGIEEGIKASLEKVVCQALSQGLSTETIVTLTGLPAEEIEKLRE